MTVAEGDSNKRFSDIGVYIEAFGTDLAVVLNGVSNITADYANPSNVDEFGEPVRMGQAVCLIVSKSAGEADTAHNDISVTGGGTLNATGGINGFTFDGGLESMTTVQGGVKINAKSTNKATAKFCGRGAGGNTALTVTGAGTELNCTSTGDNSIWVYNVRRTSQEIDDKEVNYYVGGAGVTVTGGAELNGITPFTAMSTSSGEVAAAPSSEMIIIPSLTVEADGLVSCTVEDARNVGSSALNIHDYKSSPTDPRAEAGGALTVTGGTVIVNLQYDNTDTEPTQDGRTHSPRELMGLYVARKIDVTDGTLEVNIDTTNGSATGIKCYGYYTTEDDVHTPQNNFNVTNNSVVNVDVNTTATNGGTETVLGECIGICNRLDASQSPEDPEKGYYPPKCTSGILTIEKSSVNVNVGAKRASNADGRIFDYGIWSREINVGAQNPGQGLSIAVNSGTNNGIAIDSASTWFEQEGGDTPQPIRAQPRYITPYESRGFIKTTGGSTILSPEDSTVNQFGIELGSGGYFSRFETIYAAGANAQSIPASHCFIGKAAETSLYFKEDSDGTPTLWTSSDGTSFTKYTDGKGTTWKVDANNNLVLNGLYYVTSAPVVLTVVPDNANIVLASGSSNVFASTYGGNAEHESYGIDGRGDSLTISGDGDIYAFGGDITDNEDGNSFGIICAKDNEKVLTIDGATLYGYGGTAPFSTGLFANYLTINSGSVYGEADGDQALAIGANNPVTLGRYMRVTAPAGGSIKQITEQEEVPFYAVVDIDGNIAYSAAIEKRVIIVEDDPVVTPTPAKQNPAVSYSGEGTATLSADGTTLTIKAATGYEIKDVTLNGVSRGAVTTLTGLKTGDAVNIVFAPVTGPEPVVENPYTDVSSTDWYYDAAMFCYAKGIMTGAGANTFAPTALYTRASEWQSIFNMNKGAVIKLASVSDVRLSSNEWYAEAMQWAKDVGITDGTDPNGVVTREQMAAMLLRYAKYLGIDVATDGAMGMAGYEDVGSISAWAYDAMQWAVLTGIIKGSDGLLKPQGSATRAEVAQMFMNFVQHYAK